MGSLVVLVCLLFSGGCGDGGGAAGGPERRDIILATTTSTQDSGLLDDLLPIFEERTGYRVKTIAVGTGEALAMGRRGDADVLLAHAPRREKEVVAEGYAVHRRIVMHNDFLIAGPPEDPAGVGGLGNGVEAVRRIAEAGARFVSRGDDSGTHIKERNLWTEAAIEPHESWYVSTGQGMGATLIIAGEMRAYILADRGTFLALRDRIGLVPLVEGDPRFLNIYSIMEVNPDRFPRVNHAGAVAFSEFLLSEEIQRVIGEFGVERFGQPLFYPDAGSDEESLGQGTGRGEGA